MITVMQLIERLQECATPDKTPVVLSLETEVLPITAAYRRDEVFILEIDEAAWRELRAEMDAE